MGKNRYRKTGWARTKKIPHKNHPAFFKRRGSDDIEYVTFTHSSVVDFDQDRTDLPLEKHDIVETCRLKANIAYHPKKGEGNSHVVPRVYTGKRSALGKGTNEFRLGYDDKPLIDSIFNTAKRYPVPVKDNSIKNKKTRK